MTEQQERYDRVASGYAQWWAPVIAPTAVWTLDRVAPLVEAGARRILDIGTGTGTLALAAVRRWRHIEVVGIDASAEMAAAARRAADATLSAEDRGRFEVRTAFADRLPFDGGEFDAAVSSFVLQLVPNRAAALREARRVLRPGGRLAHMTWLVGQGAFEPDRVLDEVLSEAGVGPREADGPCGDYGSVAAAAAGLRRAGFRSVAAEAVELVHPFDVEGYAGFIEQFDEESTWDEFEPAERARVSARLRERLSGLPPDALVMRAPVVLAHGDRP
ncbi:MAG TPA: class I SAM-dependent methyltransferase [Vitreimonas sp.]|nr:class I SAM-dependent methyltransferase [Vitreimonas sp.]